MELTSERLSVLRLSNPNAAFGALLSDFTKSVKKDPEMKKAFASFQKKFKGGIFTLEDARRFAALKQEQVDGLAIKVGSLPVAIGASLAATYDAAVEAMRSRDTRIDPKMFSARAIGTVERLLDRALLQMGTMGVSALELALQDKGYADRLRLRAAELEVSNFQPLPPPGGVCEFCTVTVDDGHGNVQVTCPSKDDCDKIGATIIVLIVILLLVKLFEWLF